LTEKVKTEYETNLDQLRPLDDGRPAVHAEQGDGRKFGQPATQILVGLNDFIH
jgi:hypothetical protein